MLINQKTIQFRKIKRTFTRSILIYGILGTFCVVFIIGFLVSQIEIRTNEEHSEFDRLLEQIDNSVDIEMELERRLKVVDQTCRKYGFGKYSNRNAKSSIKHPPTPLYEAFYFDRSSNLAWCPTYKAGSTNWLYNFALLGGRNKTDLDSTRKQLSEVAREVFPSLDYESGQKAFEKAKLKFFIVRHPFERILSAFRDKLENINIGIKHGTKHFYIKYGKKIVEKYRLNKTTSTTLTDNELEALETFPKGIEPTFSEFIQYINDHELGAGSDDHWMPYYMHCTPCFLHYDVIAKLETMDQDQKYILHKSGLYNILKPTWKHLTNGEKSANVIKKYFSYLTKKQLLKLYHKYRIDFEMFEYSVNDYYKYGM